MRQRINSLRLILEDVCVPVLTVLVAASVAVFLLLCELLSTLESLSAPAESGEVRGFSTYFLGFVLNLLLWLVGEQGKLLCWINDEREERENSSPQLPQLTTSPPTLGLTEIKRVKYTIYPLIRPKLKTLKQYKVAKERVH